MGKFINPFTDHGWKILFGEEASKSILIEFLNDLLEGERIAPFYQEGGRVRNEFR